MGQAGAAAAGLPSPNYLDRFVRDTGAANSVMSIILDYRGYDTLGEATVIFVAILGGYVVLRAVGRKREGKVKRP
jgi:multisubunit Na+/H+ antiporter MnhB subunit